MRSQKIKKAAAQRLTEEMSNHSWEEEIKKGPDKNWSRSVATAQFRLRTGHDVLQHHLSRFNTTDDPATCRLCTNGVQDRAHLFECANLLEGNEDVRRKKNNLKYILTPAQEKKNNNQNEKLTALWH
jgi:hypothetical protein